MSADPPATGEAAPAPPSPERPRKGAVSGARHLAPAPTLVRLGRWAAALFICWHFTASMSSSLRSHIPQLADLRKEVTMPYEKLFGMHQSWTMFVPNPPRGTTYLRVTGRTADGKDVPLEVPDGAPDPDAIAWFYSRDGKLERNVTGSKRTGLQLGYTHWLCRRAAARGVELTSVFIEAPSIRTPKMWDRAETPRPDRRRKVMDEKRRACPNWDEPKGVAF